MSVAIDRLPPQNVEAEEAVLGSILMDPSAVHLVRSVLAPGDCFRGHNGDILAAAYAVADTGAPADWVTIADELKRRGMYEEIGGTAYLSHCTTIVPTAIHVEHYAAIVRRTAIKRRLITAAGQIAAIAYDDDTEPETAAARGMQALMSINAGAEHHPVLTPEEQSVEFIDAVSELALSGESGIPSGYPDLDRMIGGFEPAQLITLLAVTSLGKSAWALSLARQMGKAGHPVLFASAEMTRRQLEWRHAAALCGVSSQELRRRVARGLDKAVTTETLYKASQAMASSNIHLWYKPGMTTSDIRAKALEWRARHKVAAVIVDYLQILSMPKGESKRVQVSEACHQLKTIAGEVGVPVITLCQVNRESVKSRPNKRPGLMDASESGSVEQDSDILLGLYRDDFHYQPGTLNDKKQVVKAGEAELLVLKQRDGPTGWLPLTWKAATCEYVSYTDQPEPSPW